MNFSAKSCKICFISWKSTKTHRFGQEYATFSNKLPCFGVSMNLSAKGIKKWLNLWKSTKNHRFGQNFATFRTNYHVFASRSTFQEKVAKSASFREKTRKTIDLAKTCNFSSKLPCLGIFVYFSERSCKKCLIPWKSTRNHRFCQHYATFRTNYHVFAFRWTFKEKVGESGSFREKARKIMDLVKTCNFSNKLPCFGVSMNFSTKCCRNCLISWKSTKTHRFRQDYATFSNKLPCFGVSMNFSEKSCKKCFISWKNTKNHRFGQNYATFSNKLPCFGVAMNFSAKCCKKWLNSWKSTKYHRFGQNFATFPTTTMSLDFDQLFRKKLQKVPHFVKNHEKSSIWPNLYNFSNKLPCLWTWMNFSRKSCKRCLISWKSTRNHRSGQIFITFRTNYHVFAFRSTFQEKVAKSASSRKKHEKSSIWPKLCNFSNKLPCLCISINFSGKSCKKCLIWWKNTKNHRFGQNLQFFEETTMSWHFHELFRKKLQKVPHFVKKHEKSSISPKIASFRKNYHLFSFRWTLWQKVAKTASFREKARKLIDLAKTMQLFRTNYHVLVFPWTFEQKVAKSRSIREKARKIMD